MTAARWLAACLVLLAAPAAAQDYPPELPPIPPPAVETPFGFAMAELDPVPLAADGEPVTIRVLVARTSGVSSTLCQQGIDQINTGLRNSDLAHVTVQLANCVQTATAGGGDAATVLSRLRTANDGYFEDVLAAREQYAADTVVLLNPVTGACGVAYIAAPASSAFAVVAPNCLGQYSFIHEWLHNIGVAHDAPNASWIPNGYAAGWCFVRADGSKCGHKDVMVYPSPCAGSRVNRISNPDRVCPTHTDVPTGTATANGARMVRERAAIVANFRTPPILTGKPPSRPLFPRVTATLVSPR